VHPADRERIARSLREAVEKGCGRWSERFRFLRRDGTYASVLGRGFISHDRAGNPVRIIGGLIDITDQRQLERQLEEAVRVRGDFLLIASHELRTPLTALRMQIQGLIKGPNFDALDERVRTRLNGVERSVMRMIQLVDELLDVSRLNADHLELEPEDVDLTEVIGEVIERMQPDIRRSGSTLEVAAPEAVPGHWDRSRLDQIVSNLLSNAVKYGEGKPIDIRVEADETHARLTIRDRGIGIAPAEQARIPVVVMTAAVDGATRPLNVAAVLRKPLGYEELLEAVGRGRDGDGGRGRGDGWPPESPTGSIGRP